jgi:hypothetical protein
MQRRSSAIVCVLFATFGCATSEDPGSAPATDPASAVQNYKRVTAAHAAEVLSDPTARAAIVEALRQHSPLAISDLPALISAAAIPDGAVPEVWLHEASATHDTADLVVAYAPAGAERTWTTVPAYALSGERLTLDPQRAPDVPVLVIETHGRLATRQAVADANLALQRAGLQRTAERPVAQATAARDTTRLDAVHLNNDEEPWISGAAEIYAVVSGVIGDNDPQVRIVDMPYLDNDGTTYTPHQIIVDWTDYAYQAVNIQLFEHDDNTSYQQLVTVLISAIGAAGSLAGVPEIQAVTEIANRIIAALPSSVFTNDDDYVDSFYTVEKTTTYTGLVGASGNATVSLTPFVLQPN